MEQGENSHSYTKLLCKAFLQGWKGKMEIKLLWKHGYSDVREKTESKTFFCEYIYKNIFKCKGNDHFITQEPLISGSRF